MCILQILTYSAVDKGIKASKSKVFRTMMQLLELLQLAKWLISEQSNVEQ